MPRALITGVAGQDGVYLARLLSSRGYDVVGTARPASAVLSDPSPYWDDIDLAPLELRDTAGFESLIDDLRPDEIYNLAGFSSVGASWAHAVEVAETNGVAVVAMLDALVRHRDRHGQAPRFFQPSSSEMFGTSDHQPQTESTPHHPRSPYAASKSFAHHIAVNYRESYGLFITTGTLYNHESPLRGAQFVTRKISRSVAEIALGRRDTLTLGNLDVRRDWGFAGDYVQAMHATLRCDEPLDFIIATGHSHSLADLLAAAFAGVGIDDPTPYIVQDPALMRPADVAELVGDPTKAREELDWAPELGFAETIHHMVRTDIRRLETGVEESVDYLHPV